MKSQLIRYFVFVLVGLVIISCDDDAVAPPDVVSSFTASKTTVEIGEVIQFTNTSQNATAFKWSFGDGTTSKELSPKKTYASSGQFVVTLLATGAGGSTMMTMEITVLPDPEIFFVEAGTSLIRSFGIKSTDKVNTFLDISGFAGVGLAYDAENEKVYFSDFEVTGDGKIWRVNLDGTDLEEIISGLYDPYQIALDLVNKKIYWAEDWDPDDISRIGRANLDGSNLEYVVSMDGAQFRAIDLDVANNKMYFYDVWYEDLYVANLDGSDATPIVSGVYGYAVAVDHKNGKIYFDDQNSGSLLRADLDGDNIETIDDNGTRIYGMAIDFEKGKLYWSGRDSGAISQANLDGSHKVDIKTGLSSPRGIFLKK
jgi:DNA-binding beta-propeller fold protein YncE